MKTKFIYTLLIAFLASIGCSAQNEKLPDTIMLSYEGLPRAHIPTIIWFAGETLPVIIIDEEHDEFWKTRYEAAPKFPLKISKYMKLELLLNGASKNKDAYVLELLYSDRKPEIRYFNAKSFSFLREAIKDALIKGYEVLADWSGEKP
jgi:hypothetical protein